MSLYTDRGVVLRTYKLGEADRIVVLATRDHGKVRGVAKGVRKTKSRIGSRLEPTSHVALQLYEGRGDLDTVTQVDSIDHFPTIRSDLDRLTRAVSMLEVVDHVALDREPNPQLYEMLVGALRTLEKDDPPLIVAGFFLKLLLVEGFGPVVDSCVVCGVEAPLVAFDLELGGVLCSSHRRGPSLSPDGLEVLRKILGGRLGAALNEPESPATNEIDGLARGAIEHLLERRLRAPTVLDRG